jgi:Na+-driven multidrug efflux pump
MLGICLPLVIVSVLSWVTSGLTNTLYSRFGGEYFVMYGMIGIVLVSVQQIIYCIIGAAWIKTAWYYVRKTAPEETPYLANSIYATLIAETMLIILCLIGKNLIFRFFHIPASLYTQANAYYVAYLLGFYLTSIGYMGITLVNGVGGAQELLIVNLINSCANALVAAVLLGVFRLGIVGAALILPVNGLILLAYTVFVFRKKGIPFPRKKAAFRVDKKLLCGILKAGILMGAQTLWCQIGDICISVQTNRYLSVDYISVLSITLPFASVFSAFSTAITTFVPPNYQAGNKKRIAQFLRLSVLFALAYSVFCCLLFVALGEWYYSTLFSDVKLIAMGARYWVLYGISMIPVSFLYTIRYFLDCVEKNTFAMLAGVMQLLGGLLVAFILIPRFGQDARSFSAFIVFFFPAVYVIIAYFALRKEIYKQKA